MTLFDFDLTAHLRVSQPARRWMGFLFFTVNLGKPYTFFVASHVTLTVL
jgi:hypothetical protein